jgi:CDP-glucose 4,6-dehydratase
MLGAQVVGYSLEPPQQPNLWTLLNLKSVKHCAGDICDQVALRRVLAEHQPEVVLHLAAQALVRRSYREPIETFAANVMGVVTLLHLVSQTPSVRAVVSVTSDKCYQNVEQIWPYRETDPMGGRDPYSASKGCAELVTASMRQSFFAPYAESGANCRVGSARAGNVVGGGDWSEDRLIPDIIRGCLGDAGTVVIRSPHSLRPWQHVLEPLRGYLMLAEQLALGTPATDDGWNFGPDRADERPVAEVAAAVVHALGRGKIVTGEGSPTLHEAKLLRLDSSKARQLGWQPKLSFEQTVAMTAGWYAAWAAGSDVGGLCQSQIHDYMKICGDTHG